ncbi:MAG: recombinase family protein [Oscillospiraceae bacterium]|nr:recombinase family protein [Oscillospiraceae bacterium]
MKRIAAYCRVSTEKNDQQNSFESQKRYFKEYIGRQPDWELAGIFADEGVSGTSTKKRKAFNDMIFAAKSGCFDFIITREISRFARNTLDSIHYTRELKKLGVGVIFLADNINTLDADAELRLTIMSSIAQEESRKTSERVKWGQRRRMEQGVVFGRDLLGYDVRGGRLYINEDGAKTVRMIFKKFTDENKGTHTIARELNEAGIKSMHAGEWKNTAVLRVLRNEKYCGDLVQKKTITPDYLSHDKKYNRGEEDFIILKDHHEPIVSRGIFEAAARLLDERAGSQKDKAKYSRRYVFSGKIKCGNCNSSYVARKRKHLTWRCYKSCGNKGIRDEAVMGAASEAAGARVTRPQSKSSEEEIRVINMKKARLLGLYMDGIIDKDEFVSARARLEKELAKANEINGTEITDGEFYRSAVERIVVGKGGEIKVQMKCI